MQPIQNQLALRILLLVLALTLATWPVILVTPFSITSITISILSIWVILIAILIGLAR
ncbi:hypothetical protein [Vibrio hepatarius]|uniref:hypothetical protein n=1 Tax=Vibrio hepatarius TaxID=171383 RepID=UPI003735837D